MKKLTAVLLILILIVSLSSCEFKFPVEPTYEYTISSEQNRYVVNVGEELDFKSLFTIIGTQVGDVVQDIAREVEVTDDMIVAPEADFTKEGTFTVTCTYEGAVKSIIIVVKAGEPTPNPTPDPSKPAHAGTKNDPYTVADALIVLENLELDAEGEAVTEMVYVKGIVTDAGSPSSNGNYFKGIEIADTKGGSATLYIYSANPNSTSDKAYKVGDTILLNGYLRVYDFTTAEMGSSNGKYTYFSIVNTSSGSSTGGSTGGNTNQMPAQSFNPGNHVANDDILSDATKNYISKNPNNDNVLATGLPSQGAYNVLVIPVEFKNDKFTSSELSDLEKAFNGTSAQTGWNSVNSYYLTSSYGKLDLDFDIWSTPVTMPNNYSYYENQQYGSEDILQYALGKIDPSVDLSQYDTDSDGYIDAVYIIYSAPINYDDSSSIFWAFMNWEFESNTFDGVEAHCYLFAGIDFMYEEIEGSGEYAIDGLKINASTYIHETGHLLGLDDYYDYNPGEGSDEGVGNADMMDYTVGDHNAYSKLLLGWVNPTVVTSTQTVTLDSFTESGEFIIVLLDYDGTYFSKYLIIDLYTATGLNAMHAGVEGSYLYDGEPYGARIYHVSSDIKTPFNDEYYSFTTNNNSISSTPLLKLVEADGDDNYESDTYTEGGYDYRFASYDDLWQSGSRFSEMHPNYTRNDGKLINFDISFDSVTEDSATVTITFN